MLRNAAASFGLIVLVLMAAAALFILQHRTDTPPRLPSQSSASPSANVLDTQRIQKPTHEEPSEALAFVIAANHDEAEAILNSEDLRRRIDAVFPTIKAEMSDHFKLLQAQRERAKEYEAKISAFKIRSDQDRLTLHALKVERDTAVEMAGELVRVIGFAIYRRALK